MAKADAVEVTLSGGERSGTRWANSSITTNLVQYDRNLSVTVYLGDKAGSASTRDFSDAGLQGHGRRSASPKREAGRRQSPNLPELLGPQTYIPVDAALLADGELRPGRARADGHARASTSARRWASLGAGYIPKTDQTNCTANSKGLFAYYRDAEAGFVLTCRMADGSGSGWAGITGVKDLEPDRREGAHAKSRRTRRSRAASREDDRARPVHGDSRAARQRALPVAHDRHLQRRRRIRRWRRTRRRARRRGGRAAAGGPTAAAAAVAVAARWRRWRRRRRRRRQRARAARSRRQDLQRSVHAEERHRQSTSCGRRRSSATTRRPSR